MSSDKEIVNQTSAGVDITADFTDRGFRRHVYGLIRKKAPEPILDTDVANIASLNLNFVYFQNLSGLEHFIGLKELILEGSYWCRTLPALPLALTSLNCRIGKLSQLPELPPGLEKLICGDNHLEELPALPSSLKVLSCESNNLTFLPPLPEGLTSLDCSENLLTELPALPPGLQELYCDSNELTNLPDSPTALSTLRCARNRLTELPTLPPKLKSISCGYNQLSVLPELPLELKCLNCDENELTRLPSLPAELVKLGCAYNRLIELPALPLALEELGCDDNLFTVLPELPPQLRVVEYRDNRVATLPVLPPSIHVLCLEGNLLKKLPPLQTGVKVFNKNSEYVYSIYNDQARIENYFGNAAEVVIPSVIDNRPVTAIDRDAFTYNRNVKRVIIPESVTEVAGYAFWASSITHLTIPAGVSRVPQSFLMGDSLEIVCIMGRETEIDEDAFQNYGKYTIRCHRGSKAHEFAIVKKLPVEFIEGEEHENS